MTDMLERKAPLRAKGDEKDGSSRGHVAHDMKRRDVKQPRLEALHSRLIQNEGRLEAASCAKATHARWD